MAPQLLFIAGAIIQSYDKRKFCTKKDVNARQFWLAQNANLFFALLPKIPFIMPKSQPTAKQLQALKVRILSDWIRQRTAEQSRNAQSKSDNAEESDGAICAQWKRCGRPNCRCARGELHGPYYYRFYRKGEKLKKEYLSAKCPLNQQLIEQALANRADRVEQRGYRQQDAQFRADAREARELLQAMGGTARFGERTLAEAQEYLRRKRQQRTK